MRLMMIVMLSCCLGSSVSQAKRYAESNTHLYVLSANGKDLLKLDLISGCKTEIPLKQEAQNIAYYAGRLYVGFDTCEYKIYDADLNKVGHAHLHHSGGESKLFTSIMRFSVSTGYVTDEIARVVYVFDKLSNKFKKPIKVGNNPQCIAFKSHFAFVTCWGSKEVVVINTHDNRICARIPVGEDPMYIAIKDRYAYVSNEASHSLSVIDTRSKKWVKDIPLTGRPGQAIINGPYVFVPLHFEDQIAVIDLKTHQLVKMIKTGFTSGELHVRFGMGFILSESLGVVFKIDLDFLEVVDRINIDSDKFKDVNIKEGLALTNDWAFIHGNRISKLWESALDFSALD